MRTSAILRLAWRGELLRGCGGIIAAHRHGVRVSRGPLARSKGRPREAHGLTEQTPPSPGNKIRKLLPRARLCVIDPKPFSHGISPASSA